MIRNTLKTKEKYEVKGAITALLNRLAALPAQSGAAPSKVPLLLYKNDNLKPATEADAMLGMMLVENFLGGAFSLAANDNGSITDINGAQSALCLIGPDDLADIYSEYLQDRDDPTDKRGKGTYALDGSKPVRCPFNKAACSKGGKTPPISPARAAIEKSLAHCLRELEILTADEKYAAPQVLAA